MIHPSIEQLRQRPAMARLEARYGRSMLARRCGRRRPRCGRLPHARRAVERLVEHIERALCAARRNAEPSLRRVINATASSFTPTWGGPPLGQRYRRVAAVAGGYSNLEYDLREVRRGRRDTHAERLLCGLTARPPQSSSTTMPPRRSSY